MSTTQQPSTGIEPYDFQPKLNARFALNMEQVLTVALFGALFVVLNYIPLRVTDIWGHIGYGEWMLNELALPTADPWMPLAQGMQVIDSAWLSQLIFASVDRYLGTESLSHLFAVVNLVTYIVWTRVFFLLTRRLWLSVAGTGLMIFVGWSRFATIRPENFAVLLFALLFLLLVRGSEKREEEGDGNTTSFNWLTWVGVPIIFALWANLHGSFVVGLAVLGCFWLGRIVEVAWQTRSFSEVICDGQVRRWTFLTELALLATLLNPYGLDLWIYTIRFAGNPNLATVLEWQPLVVLGVGGRQFAISIILLLVVWRHSRRKIRPAEVLLLAVFGLAAIGGVRMLGWYAAVYVVALAPHIAEIFGRLLPVAPPAPEMIEAEEEGKVVLPPGHSFRYSLVALLLIWIAFALSPASQLIFNKSRTPEQLYGKETPVELIAYLNSAYNAGEVPGGIVFGPQWWGDWLAREVHPPPPEPLAAEIAAAQPAEQPAEPALPAWQYEPFVTSNIHLAPPQVWRDYLRVMAVRSGWDGVLDRYDIDTVVVDKKEQETFFGVLNRSEDWSRRYEDDLAAVFTRVVNIPGQQRADSVEVEATAKQDKSAKSEQEG